MSGRPAHTADSTPAEDAMPHLLGVLHRLAATAPTPPLADDLITVLDGALTAPSDPGRDRA
ncbi:hypothetical protein OHA77_03645 [Streptosporangium sp. NBC_01639]|uniref:hypothetical protein n=1 Tax=Streptosporangium sp. NBC_01639 TaxID=2975948 RepID=UPI00386CFFC0|nr:hypothetical protein OHA77_03645 [Streptosporangium sp. NBC_01639]